MKKKTFLLWAAALTFILSSCTSSKLLQKNPAEEWQQFDVATYWHQDNEQPIEVYNAHVAIQRVGDSVISMSVFMKDEKSHVTSNRLTTINTDYQFIASYPDSVFWYDEGLVDILQQSMDYFPMYYPKNNSYRVTIEDTPLRDTVLKDDTLKFYMATKIIRRCYTDGHCEMDEIPVMYTYSTKKKMYTSAISIVNPERNMMNVSKITNISHKDCSKLIKKEFDLTSHAYQDYDFLPENEYYPPQLVYTEDTTMTDTVLDWPIVNLATGDTTSLRSMQGTTMLHFFTYYLDSSWYTSDQQAAEPLVDNVVWLMPISNNVERMKQLAREGHLGQNIYYTKQFTRHLSSYYDAFLIDANHRTVAAFDRNKRMFEEWVDLLKQQGKL